MLIKINITIKIKSFNCLKYNNINLLLSLSRAIFAMLEDIDICLSHNTEHNSSREIHHHGKQLVTDGRGRNGECYMMSTQLTDRIVTKIKNGYYENEQFPFTSLSRNKLKKDEIQTRR